MIESPFTPHLSASLPEASPVCLEDSGAYWKSSMGAAPALRGSQGPGPRWLPPAPERERFPLGEAPAGPPPSWQVSASAGRGGWAGRPDVEKAGPKMEEAWEK